MKRLSLFIYFFLYPVMHQDVLFLRIFIPIYLIRKNRFHIVNLHFLPVFNEFMSKGRKELTRATGTIGGSLHFTALLNVPLLKSSISFPLRLRWPSANITKLRPDFTRLVTSVIMRTWSFISSLSIARLFGCPKYLLYQNPVGGLFLYYNRQRSWAG